MARCSLNFDNFNGVPNGRVSPQDLGPRVFPSGIEVCPAFTNAILSGKIDSCSWMAGMAGRDGCQQWKEIRRY